MPRTLYAPIAISGALFSFIVVGCLAVRAAECNGGFCVRGVSSGVVFALVLIVFVDARVNLIAL